jgi:hypothetical protein
MKALSARVVLEFHSLPEQDMFVACLWSGWAARGQPDLQSFVPNHR